MLELLATLCAAVFAGAALYINVVEHPARMSLGPTMAVAEWRPAYQRGAMMQAPLAVVGFLAGAAAWLTGAGGAWLLGGTLLGAVVPFTFFATMPTNRQLMSPAVNDVPGDARKLLDRWNRLHAVRTGLSLAALLLFLSRLG